MRAAIKMPANIPDDILMLGLRGGLGSRLAGNKDGFLCKTYVSVLFALFLVLEASRMMSELSGATVIKDGDVGEL
ncbi:hypothetical protein CEXT_256841 [Caerostris extrusa]|uniref:Uncharacterized protein n=1 Tax=Caerostris extrusa TaxID=172846 RepID=A0AAV4WYT5_CAEEX|nr:hypothetical protein CEXT_256841 [Caerostris extrusa]